MEVGSIDAARVIFGGDGFEILRDVESTSREHREILTLAHCL